MAPGARLFFVSLQPEKIQSRSRRNHACGHQFFIKQHKAALFFFAQAVDKAFAVIKGQFFTVERAAVGCEVKNHIHIGKAPASRLPQQFARVAGKQACICGCAAHHPQTEDKRQTCPVAPCLGQVKAVGIVRVIA